MHNLTRDFRPTIRKSLSPRRFRAILKLAAFLRQTGGKCFFDSKGYDRCQLVTSLTRTAINAAIEDAFETAAVEVRLIGDDLQVVQLRQSAAEVA